LSYDSGFTCPSVGAEYNAWLKYQIEEDRYVPGQSTEVENEYKIQKNVAKKRVAAFILSEKTDSAIHFGDAKPTSDILRI
jgi:hypothetical protein